MGAPLAILNSELVTRHRTVGRRRDRALLERSRGAHPADNGQYLPVVLQNWGAESRHSQIEVKLGLGDL
jgi:hypothetical protein